MEIWHRVAFNRRDEVDSIVEGMGIGCEKMPLPGNGYVLIINIRESDAVWPELAALIREKNAFDLVGTVFTTEEILSAEWVRLVPNRQQGYPQPEETWVRNPINYADVCPQCGTHRQVAGFRLKREPKLGKRDFTGLHWTYAVFCTPRVFEAMEANAIRGHEAWPAVIHSTGLPARIVSQLFIPQIAAPALAEDNDLPKQTCPVCHVTKYLPHRRGWMYLKREALPRDVELVRSAEWFGDGHAAYREILISHRLAKLILDSGWKGIDLKAAKPV